MSHSNEDQTGTTEDSKIVFPDAQLLTPESVTRREEAKSVSTEQAEQLRQEYSLDPDRIARGLAAASEEGRAITNSEPHTTRLTEMGEVLPPGILSQTAYEPTDAWRTWMETRSSLLTTTALSERLSLEKAQLEERVNEINNRLRTLEKNATELQAVIHDQAAAVLTESDDLRRYQISHFLETHSQELRNHLNLVLVSAVGEDVGGRLAHMLVLLTRAEYTQRFYGVVGSLEDDASVYEAQSMGRIKVWPVSGDPHSDNADAVPVIGHAPDERPIYCLTDPALRLPQLPDEATLSKVVLENPSVTQTHIRAIYQLGKIGPTLQRLTSRIVADLSTGP